MSANRRLGRRDRRDRAAKQIAATLLCGIGMVCAGGVWWLATPDDRAEAERVTPAIGPAFVINTAPISPAAPVSPIAASLAIAEIEAESAELEAPAAELEVVKEVDAKAANSVAVAAASPAAVVPKFNGRPIRPVRTVRMIVTAYSPDARSCGNSADNITASGYSVWTNGMKLVAADARLFEFGAILTVPGYNDGMPVPVLDRGGAIKGKRLDVLYPTHEIARLWGVRHIDVVVWEYAD